MKLTSTAAIAALSYCLPLAVASELAQVYIIDSSLEPTAQPQTLSRVAARLVLAQRAGIEDYHSADLKNEEVLDAINAYGVRTSLFGKQEDKKRAFVLLNGRDGLDIPFLKDRTYFEVDSAPSWAATSMLWADLSEQVQPYDDNFNIEKMSQEEFEEHHENFGTVRDKKQFIDIATSRDDLEIVLKNLAKEKDEITIYVTPEVHGIELMGFPVDIWGTYEMPTTQSPLKKRSAQRPQKEAPLEEFTPPVSFVPVESSTSDVSPLIFKDNNSSQPLTGILPACFTSQSACESTTRNCTGHGKCSKKFTDTSGSDKQSCWSCQCSATKSETKDGGVRTTVWGGPACQKQDVSVQFWMLALFSVGLVFLVGFAVGELMGMGSEELPSVIGAGVSGPVKRG